MHFKGIVLAGGSGTRLYPLTRSVSKQLMPVYDKPMIYYPLSVLMLSGIREILIISTPLTCRSSSGCSATAAQFGLRIEYRVQPSPDGSGAGVSHRRGFSRRSPGCLILGDNLFYGHDLAEALGRSVCRTEGATIFGYRVADPTAYGVVEFAADGRVLSLEEKPRHRAATTPSRGCISTTGRWSKWRGSCGPARGANWKSPT